VVVVAVLPAAGGSATCDGWDCYLRQKVVLQETTSASSQAVAVVLP
jgi:hypothetical protein